MALRRSGELFVYGDQSADHTWIDWSWSNGGHMPLTAPQVCSHADCWLVWVFGRAGANAGWRMFTSYRHGTY
jgi:hypothetical protein